MSTLPLQALALVAPVTPDVVVPLGQGTQESVEGVAR